jgi:hypothetical protein
MPPSNNAKPTMLKMVRTRDGLGGGIDSTGGKLEVGSMDIELESVPPSQRTSEPNPKWPMWGRVDRGPLQHVARVTEITNVCQFSALPAEQQMYFACLVSVRGS